METDERPKDWRQVEKAHKWADEQVAGSFAKYLSDEVKRQNARILALEAEVENQTGRADAEKSVKVFYIKKLEEAEVSLMATRFAWHDFKIRLVETYGGPTPYLDRVMQDKEKALAIPQPEQEPAPVSFNNSPAAQSVRFEVGPHACRWAPYCDRTDDHVWIACNINPTPEKKP
jgi:hypothetical protein